MNERIKELANKAGYTPLPGFDFANELQEVFLDKFAKLIVRECIECLNPLSRNHSMVGAAQNTIKKHFGVEE